MESQTKVESTFYSWPFTNRAAVQKKYQEIMKTFCLCLDL